jgi:hypothetical protein
MNRQGFFDRFDFDNDQATDNHVHSKAGVDAHISINDGHKDLTFDSELPDSEFVTETLLVDRLQQTWTERLMDRESGIDDLPGSRIMFGRRLGQLGAFAAWRLNGGSALLRTSRSALHFKASGRTPRRFSRVAPDRMVTDAVGEH